MYSICTERYLHSLWKCNGVMLQGAGTKDSVLIEIFASRSPEQIRALSDVYLQGKDDDLNDLKDLNVENIVLI